MMFIAHPMPPMMIKAIECALKKKPFIILLLFSMFKTPTIYHSQVTPTRPPPAPNPIGANWFMVQQTYKVSPPSPLLMSIVGVSYPIELFFFCLDVWDMLRKAKKKLGSLDHKFLYS
jgi:hypothetical protein